MRFPINQKDPLREGGKGSEYKYNLEDVKYPEGGPVGPLKGTKVVMRDNRQTLDKIEHEDPTYQEEMNVEPVSPEEPGEPEINNAV